MRRLSMFAAVIVVLVMATVSFAANTANINVTSEPIAAGSTCNKAGGFALTFDNGTTFAAGDRITFDLDFGVTLCRDIDLEIGAVAGAGVHAGLIGTAATIPAVGTTNAITATAGSLDGVNGGVIFKITGVTGQSRVTIEVFGDANGDGTLEGAASGASVTFDASGSANPASETLRIGYLDQEVYTALAGTYAIFENAANGNYNVGSDLADNTLCIDVASIGGATTVNANYDSKNDKFTWIPSNPQIAHLVSANAYSFVESNKRVVGNLLTPGTASQGGPAVTCTLINNEADAGDETDGYCTTNGVLHANNKAIIQAASGFDSSLDYILELEILVNGSAGANGIYWSSDAVGTEGYANQADALAAADGDGLAVGANVHYLADGVTVATPGTDNDCDIAPTAKSVKIITAAHSGLNLANGDEYLFVELPRMVMDSSEITEGDVVTVQIKLIQAPCGELFTGTWDLGTVGCDAQGISDNATYPYFAKAGAYANAIVITNLSNSAGTASLTLYEQDGDMFTATVDVPARGLYVNLLGSIAWTGTGTQGDARGYVVITTDFSVDGAAMITNPATGESIGYLPRL